MEFNEFIDGKIKNQDCKIDQMMGDCLKKIYSILKKYADHILPLDLKEQYQLCILIDMFVSESSIDLLNLIKEEHGVGGEKIQNLPFSLYQGKTLEELKGFLK